MPHKYLVYKYVINDIKIYNIWYQSTFDKKTNSLSVLYMRVYYCVATIYTLIIKI